MEKDRHKKDRRQTTVRLDDTAAAQLARIQEHHGLTTQNAAIVYCILHQFRRDKLTGPKAAKEKGGDAT